MKNNEISGNFDPFMNKSGGGNPLLNDPFYNKLAYTRRKQALKVYSHRKTQPTTAEEQMLYSNSKRKINDVCNLTSDGKKLSQLAANQTNL
jgi:hypothetical protein